MLLCTFCLEAENCDFYPDDNECEWNGDDEAVIDYAQKRGISVSDAVALIKFCCNLR